MPRIQIGSWANDAVNWLRDNLDWLFNLITTVLNGLYNAIHTVLAAPEPLILAGILAVLAWWLRGLPAAVLTFLGFALIDSIQQWNPTIESLSLVLVACLITVVVAVPLGIWAARSKVVGGVLRPVLDLMQTMPAMVYLIPGILFFGLGVVPGIVATIVFSMPPAVRMTELGIRQVDEELVEAAEAFGTHPRRTLLRVQLPLALPTIMAGINQVIMLALSMVVIAGMVGGGGLGASVYNAISSVNVALGAEAGLAVVILAMYLDRMTGALNQRVSPLGRRALAKAQAALGGWKFLHWRPATSVAMVGVVVLALLAGGMSYLNKGGGAGSGGNGKPITLGYVNWDEGKATTYLWKEILEERGYKPKVQALEAGPLFAGQARGDIDVQTNAWLPVTHAEYWNKYKDKLEDLGTWYDKTSLEIAVPSYVKDVKTLDDLKGKAAEFGGRITGIEPGAGEMKILKDKVLKDYGLGGEYQVQESSTASMLSELDRALHNKKPIAVTLWSPHWAYDKYQLTKLKDPKGSFGSGDGLHLIGRKGFSKDLPEVAKWMKNFHLDEKQLTSLENDIKSAGEGHEQDGVRTWLKKNPGLVEKIAPSAHASYAKGKDAGKAPHIGYPAWDEGIATAYLWKNVLEKRGYRPDLRNLDIGPMWTGLSTGQIDVETDGWLPVAQKQYWDKYQNDLTDVGAWYDKTSLEIAVPSYVKDVKSMDDLRKHKDEFKGKIIGIEPGTGEMQRLKSTVLPAYGLTDFEVTSAGTSAMLAELDRAYHKKEPIAVVLWSPHWAYSKYQLTKLADPQGTWGANNQIKTLANKSFPDKFPEFHGWLKNWKMTPDELGSLEQDIQDAGKGNEDKGVEKWIDDHPGIVDKMAPVK
ncbi:MULTISPECIES: ABC transporter permease/substrate binding protein [Streptomyces]|uniref:Glycine/betaine ABC transporter permease n=2 Tax=Streptomyces TaxID=1883 RepID=A0A2N8PKE6_STRNR|nr:MULTISPECIES: ABC transporter permease/substrate binding protein [Streptomyces]PNE41489.1 glycine/betaine ABC transporter permease [Streptomyces noursei]SHM09011.1 glycine betaine/proline transport system substrate-binding protein [Streptomyces yunnanensis]